MESRRTNQLLFYLDIVLLGLGSLALVVLVHDAFAAGFASQRDAAAYSGYIWRMATEGILLTLSMSYFLVRFYKARIKDLANPWA